jgi:class 3 adenylate cyclase
MKGTDMADLRVPPGHGTVAFLFTDIEGSTRLWEQYPDAMRTALARHDALLRHAIEANGALSSRRWATRSVPPLQPPRRHSLQR